MENIRIGFIGAGNMGGALAKAVCQIVEAKNVMLADKSREKAFELAKTLCCSVTLPAQALRGNTRRAGSRGYA